MGRIPLPELRLDRIDRFKISAPTKTDTNPPRLGHPRLKISINRGYRRKIGTAMLILSGGARNDIPVGTPGRTTLSWSHWGYCDEDVRELCDPKSYAQKYAMVCTGL